MKIALIQEHVTDDIEENISMGERTVREAARSGAKLVCFSELAFLPFFPQVRNHPTARDYAEPIPGPTTARFAKLAKELGVVIVLNLYERDGDRYFDASPVINADGNLVGNARMLHVMDGPGFYEKGYYDPGDSGAVVCDTAVGRIGIAICYDRHYPEYMRALALKGADLVLVPQAGALGEWPDGLFEAEMRVAAMQNGYYVGLCNRVGQESVLNFAGESFVVDPFGQVMTQAPAGEDGILYAEIEPDALAQCPARKHFLPDRRPDVYPL